MGSDAPERKLFVESVDEVPGAAPEFSGVYAGSSFCQQALPSTGELEDMVSAAAGAGLTFHLATPVLTETFFGRAVKLAEKLAELAPGSEVIANDLGLVSVIAAEFPPLVPVAGRVLAYQRTDPVVPELVEVASGTGRGGSMKNAFRQVSVNNSVFGEFLNEMRVNRLEIQGALQGVKLDNGDFRYSVHVPFSFVSSTRYCAPAEQYTRPGRTPVVYHCDRHCLGSYFRLRPEGAGSRLIFRGNTVYVENSGQDIPAAADRVVVHRFPS